MNSNHWENYDPQCYECRKELKEAVKRGVWTQQDYDDWLAGKGKFSTLRHKIFQEHQEAHVIDFYICRGSSGTVDIEEDRRYVSGCLVDGVELGQSIAQLEVMRDQYAESIIDKDRLITREEMIQSEIDAITGGDEQEWRLEARPSLSEIMQVEQLKRSLEI